MFDIKSPVCAPGNLSIATMNLDDDPDPDPGTCINVLSHWYSKSDADDLKTMYNYTDLLPLGPVQVSITYTALADIYHGKELASSYKSLLNVAIENCQDYPYCGNSQTLHYHVLPNSELQTHIDFAGAISFLLSSYKGYRSYELQKFSLNLQLNFLCSNGSIRSSNGYAIKDIPNFHHVNTEIASTSKGFYITHLVFQKLEFLKLETFRQPCSFAFHVTHYLAKTLYIPDHGSLHISTTGNYKIVKVILTEFNVRHLILSIHKWYNVTSLAWMSPISTPQRKLTFTATNMDGNFTIYFKCNNVKQKMLPVKAYTTDLYPYKR